MGDTQKVEVEKRQHALGEEKFTKDSGEESPAFTW
jgi:hypothetical protein